MVDPKMLELTGYNGIPHLLMPVVTDAKRAARALRWTVGEMERRYKLLAGTGARNIDGFNSKLAGPNPPTDPEGGTLEPLPYIVVLVDELADLMLTAPLDIEEPIAALAQMARAVGIHLVLATQRPSVDVLTGVIKANFPSRIAFQVASKVDSRTILDMNGAEALLGHGDMLFLPAGKPEPYRVHAPWLSEPEASRVADYWRARAPLKPPPSIEDQVVDEAEGGDEEDDALVPEAIRLVGHAPAGLDVAAAEASQGRLLARVAPHGPPRVDGRGRAVHGLEGARRAGRRVLPRRTGAPLNRGARTGTIEAGGRAGTAQPSLAFVTLGCPKNQVDSEAMLGLLAKDGFRPTGAVEDAEIVVVNTCAFLSSAVEESRKTIEGIAEAQEEGTPRGTGRRRLLGAARRGADRRRDSRRRRRARHGLGREDRRALALGARALAGPARGCARRRPGPLDEVHEPGGALVPLPRALSTPRHLAYLKISEGCDHRCTFCIIPVLRGDQRSRPLGSARWPRRRRSPRTASRSSS
jgi:hypothetical protein